MAGQMNGIISKPNESDWTPDHEKILIEWADKAMCYRWLHTRANSMYSHLNAWYTIPVIIISTLTGTANFAQNRVPLDYQNYFAMVVGGFNLLGGIITTIQQFLKITQLNESHRVSGIAWDKFYRNIKIELAKHPNERLPVTQMIKMSKEEYDRLMETSPTIPDKIIQYFKDAFKNSESYNEILKPEICDVLVSTERNKNTWYNPENIERRIQEQEIQLRLKNESEQATKEMNEKIVISFQRTFFNLNNRDAMEEEIIENLQDQLDLETLQSIIDAQKSVDIV